MPRKKNGKKQEKNIWTDEVYQIASAGKVPLDMSYRSVHAHCCKMRRNSITVVTQSRIFDENETKSRPDTAIKSALQRMYYKY